MRATFEARGYTAWDPTSPAFIKHSENGDVALCIPTAFYSYHRRALDKKTPLLRSIHALVQIIRLRSSLKPPYSFKKFAATLGAEQEYFLIDKDLFLKRLDLQLTGRTLFGGLPPSTSRSKTIISAR